MIGQDARDEMIAAFITIVTVANLYFYVLFPQITSYFYIWYSCIFSKNYSVFWNKKDDFDDLKYFIIEIL